jgi:hypothetical protein
MNVSLPAFDMTPNGTYIFNASTSQSGDGNSINDALPSVNRTVGVIAGTVSATPDQICFSGSTTLSLVGSSGASTIQWQENTGSWVNVGTNSTSFTPGSPCLSKHNLSCPG